MPAYNQRMLQSMPRPKWPILLDNLYRPYWQPKVKWCVILLGLRKWVELWLTNSEVACIPDPWQSLHLNTSVLNDIFKHIAGFVSASVAPWIDVFVLLCNSHQVGLGAGPTELQGLVSSYYFADSDCTCHRFTPSPSACSAAHMQLSGEWCGPVQAQLGLASLQIHCPCSGCVCASCCGGHHMSPISSAHVADL